MSTSKLKNIILMVLVVLNFFFLALVISDNITERSTRRRTIENLATILADNGIVLAAELPELAAPTLQRTSRDAYADATLSRAVLGDCEPIDAGGSATIYAGERGTATFNLRGEFLVEFYDGYALRGSDSDPAKAVRSLLGKMRVDATQPVITAGAQTAGSETITAVCLYRNLPTYNCVITFEFERGLLTRITGRRPSGVTEAARTTERGLPTVMLGFLRHIIDAELRVTKITDVSVGYSLNVGAFGAGELVPVWRIETDDGDFLIDAMTGEITVG